MSAWKVILATLLIFGSGFVTGALLVQRGNSARPLASSPVVSSEPPAPAPWPLRADFLRRIEKQLDLTPQQHARIQKIMRDSQERTKPLWEDIGPQLREELKQVREQIQAELSPEQQEKFQELFKPRPPRKPDDTTQPEERRRRPPPPPDEPRGDPSQIAPDEP